MALAAEPVEPVLDVGGVARLRHLAVIDDVDPGLRLLRDDLGDRSGDARAERGGIDRHALLLGEHHPHQILGPRQAAGMSGEKPFAAAFHGAASAGSTAPASKPNSHRMVSGARSRVATIAASRASCSGPSGMW